MTSLIYHVTDEQACIASDTLMSRVDKTPFHFVTKIMLLPHLRGVVCGTGSANLLIRWYCLLQEQAVIPTLAWMRDHTSHFLQQLADELQISRDAKTTVYHFGWDEETTKIDGVSFNLQDQFVPKAIDKKALVIKPSYPGVSDDAEVIFTNGVDGFAYLMAKQRRTDNELPLDERACIGGELHFVQITADGIFQTMSHRFRDYDDLSDKMLARLGIDDWRT